MKTKKYQLKNGLTVILVESQKSPVVSIQAWVRTGSADEAKSEKGLSHFIEHLLFKGTDKFAPGEVAQVVEGSGGEFNAYTSFDQTVFYVTISSEFSERGLDVISQMVGFPSFIQEEVDNEREVVVEEIKRGMDSPGRQLSQKLFSTVYKKHNYKFPVIGYEEIVRGSSVKKIKNYYSDRYTPKNMFLVVAGDFKSGDMKKQIEKYFGVIPAPKLRMIVRKKEEAQTRPRVEVKNVEFRETSGYIAWPIPGAKHKDIPALDVLALILGQGESSRLVKKLKLDNHVANSIGSMAYTPKDHGVFAISFGLNFEKLGDALPMIAEELANLIHEEPNAQEIQKAVTNLQSEEYYSMETVDGIARKAGMFEFLFKDPVFYKEYNKNVQKLTPEDVRKVAKKYLKPEKLNLVGISPEDEVAFKAALKGFVKTFENKLKESKKKSPNDAAHRSKALKFKAIKGAQGGRPKIDVVDINGRLKMIFAENADSHVTSVKMAMPGGMLFESSDRAGEGELFGRVWANGTQDLSEAEINQKVEDIAGSFYGFSGRNSMGLSFEALSCFEQVGGELIYDVLTSASFSEDSIQREKRLMLEQIRNRDDSPAHVCILQFHKAIFSDHPYARDVLGTEESLSAIGRGDIEKFANNLVSPDSTTVAVSGRLDRDYWTDVMTRWCEKAPKNERIDWKMSGFDVIESQDCYRQLQKEQSHLIVGYPGLSLNSPDRFKLSVLQAILAGQGGRLFIELRDKASLAYTVSPLRFEGIDRGYFGAYIGCSVDKVTKAYSMMKDEFSKISENLVPDAELERAKRYLIGKHDIGLQKSSSVAYSVLFDELYGNPATSLYRYADDIRSVSAEDIRELAQKMFSSKETRSLVGAENSFEV